NVYNQHNQAVRAYFEGRDSDLLEIDLTKDPGWKDLCDFLGTQTPRRPFPHANSAAARERHLETKGSNPGRKIVKALTRPFKRP
ncbi:MAG: sulfotransferase, partial [Pseudomonadota bacterium]